MGRLREHGQHDPNHWSLSEIACVCESSEVPNELHVCYLTGRLVLYGSDSCSQELQRSNPTIREQAARLISIQRPKRWFQILLNCAKLKFVSYTSNLLEPMYDFQKHIMFLQKWILSPQDLPQNRSLETVPTCIVLQCSSHDNIVCIHMYDECRRSNEPSVCHKLWSILQSIVQVCSLTMEYQVFQYVPSTSISEHFEMILFDNYPLISILLLWSDGHQCKKL